MMTNDPKISVIMPIYNCELYVGEAIESILNQSFADFEFLIIDDCSTDRTLQIAQSYTDQRIKIITKEKNTGYTASLNYGISVAKGKYIARMDADDSSVVERFEMQLEFLEANPDFILCGSTVQIYGSDNIIDKPEHHNEIQIALLYGCPIAHPSVMVRKAVLEQFMYDGKMEPAEDYDLWTKMIWAGKMYNIQKPLLRYRFHEAQVSIAKSEIQQQNTAQARVRYFSKLDYNQNTCSPEIVLKYFQKKQLSGSEFTALLLWMTDIRKDNNRRRYFPEPAFSDFLSVAEVSLIRFYFSTHKRGGANLKLWFSLPLRYFLLVLQQHVHAAARTLMMQLRTMMFKCLLV